MSYIMSDMKTVTLRSLRRDAALLDSAAEGEEILVTRFGKPYVRIIPAKQPRSFLGAGIHLARKRLCLPIRFPPPNGKDWREISARHRALDQRCYIAGSAAATYPAPHWKRGNEGLV